MCSTPNIPIPIKGKKLIPFYQSWGSVGVGDNGIQYFDENYINSGYIYDAFTFTKFIFNNDLKLGSTGTDVKYLQVKLGMPSTTFGFGIFGTKTLSAVKAYQLKNNIPNTGYVGVLTRAKLNSL
jgi:peptidoglycan hydrolase-like protein with peptidoglycan-binding domain